LYDPVLQEIVAERKQMMATAGQIYIYDVDNDVIDLDNTAGIS